MPRRPTPLLPGLLSFLIVAIAVPAPVCGAGWPHDPGAAAPVCLAAYNQTYPAIAADGAGGVIIAWRHATAGGESDIYAQRLDANGAPSWTLDGVPVCTEAGFQSDALVVPDGAGGAIVVWTDNRVVSSDLYAQRLDANGAAMWAAGGVPLCTATGNQLRAVAIADGFGGAIVAWEDWRAGANPDVYAQRVDASGARRWGTNGTAYAATTYSQQYPRLAPDGAGGAFIVWMDFRSLNSDVFAAHVDSAGTTNWSGNGEPICTDGAHQYYPVAVADGLGGVIVAWQDARGGTNDIYAQRTNVFGSPLWTVNGRVVCSAVGTQQDAAILADGFSGAFVAWRDARSGTDDLYAQRLSVTGALQWVADGVALCAAPGTQDKLALHEDGAGGLLAVWRDLRFGPDYDLYAQRLSGAGVPQWTTDGLAVRSGSNDHATVVVAPDARRGFVAAFSNYADVHAQRIDVHGYLGDPAPVLRGVRDVSHDQGGHVVVEWDPSHLDAFPDYAIGQYSVWRNVPDASAWVADPAAIDRSGTVGAAVTGVKLRRLGAQGTASYWEYVGSLPARGLAGYSSVVPTTSDSLPGANPLTLFMVMAERSGPLAFWESLPDSGYSVDNLAPATPAALTGQYAEGTTRLHWAPNTEPDFAGYRLYRGTSATFDPGPSTLVATPSDTGYADPAGAPCFYRLSARDTHGNESATALVLPAGTLDAPAGPAGALALSAPAPNPARERTAMELSLPRPMVVRVTVYDQQGRRVHTLLAGEQPAGRRLVEWDGRDSDGRRVASGLYFVRLLSEEGEIVRRLVAIR